MPVNDFILSIYDIVVFATMSYSIYLYIWKKNTKKQRYFYIYIGAVFFLDIVPAYLFKSWININQFYLYYSLLLITILYFVYFYLNDYKDKFNRIILVSLAILSLVFIVFFQMQEDSLVISSNLFLILIIYQLALALQWFWYIVNHADEQNIIHKQAFWVSCALLLWSTFALFRMYPMYDLIKIDSAFLATIIDFFQVVNIITYLLYIRGLRCTDYNILRTFNHF